MCLEELLVVHFGSGVGGTFYATKKLFDDPAKALAELHNDSYDYCENKDILRGRLTRFILQESFDPMFHRHTHIPQVLATLRSECVKA